MKLDRARCSTPRAGLTPDPNGIGRSCAWFCLLMKSRSVSCCSTFLATLFDSMNRSFTQDGVQIRGQRREPCKERASPGWSPASVRSIAEAIRCWFTRRSVDATNERAIRGEVRASITGRRRTSPQEAEVKLHWYLIFVSELMWRNIRTQFCMYSYLYWNSVAINVSSAIWWTAVRSFCGVRDYQIS